MEISNDTKNLIEKINDYSENPVKNYFEFSIILESSLVFKREKEFQDLIFTAKYVNGLSNIFSNKAITGDKYIEKLFEEFNKNLERTIELIKKITDGINEKNARHFNEKYFQLNQDNVANVMSLVKDLTICKEFFNENKN